MEQVPKVYRGVYRQLLSYARRYGWYLMDIKFGVFSNSNGISFYFYKDSYLSGLEIHMSNSFFIANPYDRYSSWELERRFNK